MKIPRLVGVIERRLLISYAVDPALVQALLPEGLRPQLVAGQAVAGVCLIRMGSLRPAFIKPPIGWGGENAAYRIAVEYEDATGATKTGVYVPQRFSQSYLPVLAGGRIFPGAQTKASFTVHETPETIQVAFTAGQAEAEVRVAVTPTSSFSSALFPDLAAASAFYRDSPVAWSPAGPSGRKEGLELATTAWHVEPGTLTHFQSRWLDSLPAAQATFDHVLIMEQVPVEWRAP
jgi:hypothetical protein